MAHSEPTTVADLDALFAAVRAAKFTDETRLVDALVDETPYDDRAADLIEAQAAQFVRAARARDDRPMLDTFLSEYGLSNKEGVALMCIAESLLRVPDQDTAERLIADKLALGDWAAHAGKADSLLVNASTWALMLTGRLVTVDDDVASHPGRWLDRLTARVSEPVVETAMRAAMQILGREFVLGTTIERALDNSAAESAYSYDMLGEAARDAATAQRYFESYSAAIEAVGKHQARGNTSASRASVSIKLSALHPRFETRQRARVRSELVPVVTALCLKAMEQQIELTIDAEEAHRTELTLEIFERLVRDESLAGFPDLGLVVQAYGKRAREIIAWLTALAEQTNRCIPVRLVKGAYWDAEVKHAQVEGLADFPVFTRKPSTDLSYIVCAAQLLGARGRLRGQFATHNAHTVAAVLHMGAGRDDFEFQRLHGMGEALYPAIASSDVELPGLRTYAPVGSHDDLLAYLVRRLLENGANSSFVNRFLDEDLKPEDLVRDPSRTVVAYPNKRHPRIRRPRDLYPNRENSLGEDLSDTATLTRLEAAATAATLSPNIPSDASPRAIEDMMSTAAAAQPAWDATPADERARVLEACADALEASGDELISLLSREAGKTLDDGVAEVREAVDFCRYYAGQARARFAEAVSLPSPTGETNALALHGRGVFVCISPWNFPLAIFLGQVTAALAAGNSVVAKPAEQTPAIAIAAHRALMDAGLPAAACQLALGGGEVGQALVDHPLTAGVAFTGGTDTARHINAALAARPGQIIPLIAETGGQNAMLVDSTALLEQVTDDAVRSAFGSAGQRCSALRVLYLQQDIADRAIELIQGAMDELRIGDPGIASTDVGPVITEAAAAELQAHINAARASGALLHQTPLTGFATSSPRFVAPTLIDIKAITDLDREHFGPILHVARFASDEFESVLEDINACGYGLTLGLHTRIESRIDKVAGAVRVGNVYANRNMTGAVVGTQPFGGQGLSGTGFKAGGPHYLLRFATEQTLTINTVASGGNAVLLSLD